MGLLTLEMVNGPPLGLAGWQTQSSAGVFGIGTGSLSDLEWCSVATLARCEHVANVMLVRIQTLEGCVRIQETISGTKAQKRPSKA